jgi:ubiquinone/menaquinone biosynthesis C-methylase UbiE
MKTHYEDHDRLYQGFKAQGQPGWDSEYANFKTHIEKILAHGIAPTSGRLLELGCGAGNMTLWFANKGYEVSGVDISPTAIEWAEENAREMKLAGKFCVGNVTDLAEYPDDYFDFIFDGHCLHCIIHEDRGRMSSSVHRVLKPGGYFLVDTMSAPVDLEKLQQELAATDKHFDDKSKCVLLDSSDIAIRYLGNPQEIVREVDVAGFDLLRWIVDSTQQDTHHDLTIEAIKA